MKPEIRAELETRGARVVRGVLYRHSDEFGRQSRHALIRLGAVTVQVGDVEDWLKFKSAQRVWWLTAGMTLGLVFALLMLIAMRRSAS
ncbi:MAG: hypothetical protein ABJA60_02820 [Nitrosospira sp.]